jgi:predicted amino acid-binding ACT domain protein
MVKSIVTVVGQDKVGIIAGVSVLLAKYGVNILDINQTVMQEYFTMVMLVDTQGCLPPERTAIETMLAPASRAFSTSSLTTEAGRSTTSPAAI